VPVDWSQLIHDLCRWSDGRDQVAKEWLQAYYLTLNDPGYEEGLDIDDPDEDNADNTEE
jgi:hypothetical protein